MVLPRKLLSVLLFWIKVGIFALFVSAPFASARRENPVYSNEFAVNVPGGDTTADLLAAKHGFINKGQVRTFFLFFLITPLFFINLINVRALKILIKFNTVNVDKAGVLPVIRQKKQLSPCCFF